VDRLETLYEALLQEISPPEDVSTITFSSDNSDESKRTSDHITDDSQKTPLNRHNDEAHQPQLLSSKSRRKKTRKQKRRRKSQYNFNNKSFLNLPPSSMAAAWRILSAAQSPEKEGISSTSALASRDEKLALAIHLARRTEARVVEMIRLLGELVVFGEQQPHSEDANYSDLKTLRNHDVEATNSHRKNKYINFIFEFFCDKHILPFLVDIVYSRPPTSSVVPNSYKSNFNISFHGVTYTALVKAQVLQTISILIANVQDETSLYFLLSNNCINQLIVSLLPLHQFTRDSLEEMMPTYITFLKTLALKLAHSPHLFHLYVIPGNSTIDSNVSSQFALFPAAVEVAISSYTSSESSFVHLTALNIILNLCQIQSDDIRSSIGECVRAQHLFFQYLCRKLLSIYDILVQLVTSEEKPLNPGGNKINSEDNKNENMIFRSEQITRAIAKLQDELHFLNDLLLCGVRPLNVRFSEFILKHVIYSHILKPWDQNATDQTTDALDGFDMNLNDDGIMTSKVHAQQEQGIGTPSESNALPQAGYVCITENVNESEAKQMVSALFLTQCFLTLEYAPLLRMLAVSLLHPNVPSEMNRNCLENDTEGGEYAFTTALHEVITSCNHRDVCKSNDYSPSNPYRKILLQILAGKFGDRTSIPSFLMLQSIFESSSMDQAFLDSLFIFPFFSSSTSKHNDENCSPSSETGACIRMTDESDGVKDLIKQEKPGSAKKGEKPVVATSNMYTEIHISSPFEDSIYIFLTRHHKQSSPISSFAMECAGSFILSFVSIIVRSILYTSEIETVQAEYLRNWEKHSAIIKGLQESKVYYAKSVLDLRNSAGVSELFVDLVEMEIVLRYAPMSSNDDTSIPKIIQSKKQKAQSPPQAFFCALDRYSAYSLRNDSEVLLLKKKDFAASDIEDIRFAIQMTLHLTGLHKEVQSFLQSLKKELLKTVSKLLNKSNWFKFQALDILNEDVFPFLKDRPDIGTELDLRGRILFFSCDISSQGHLGSTFNARNWTGRRSVDEDIEVLKRAASRKALILIVDPTELYVVTTNESNDSNRGKIIFCFPLQAIIATATDAEWLHIAVRQAEDIGIAAENGNMAFRFDSIGTCLIVHQYIDKCRVSLRKKISSQVSDFFETSIHS